MSDGAKIALIAAVVVVGTIVAAMAIAKVLLTLSPFMVGVVVYLVLRKRD